MAKNPYDYRANICPQLNVGETMTRGQDVVAAFVQRHPDLLKSPHIHQELAGLINTALTEAYELGLQNMIDEISATVLQVARKRRKDNVGN